MYFLFSQEAFLIVETNIISERREVLVTSSPVSTVMKTTEANPNVLHHQEQGSFFCFISCKS